LKYFIEPMNINVFIPLKRGGTPCLEKSTQPPQNQESQKKKIEKTKNIKDSCMDPLQRAWKYVLRFLLVFPRFCEFWGLYVSLIKLIGIYCVSFDFSRFQRLWSNCCVKAPWEVQ